MHFGNWIVVVFILFALFIASLVFIAVRQDVNLVSQHYYQKERLYQRKKDRMKNAGELSSPPEITFSGNNIKVVFGQFNHIEGGRLQLLRPSDPRLDHTFSIRPSRDTTQYFLLSPWNHGPYRVSMQWRMLGEDFYIEKMIVL